LSGYALKDFVSAITGFSGNAALGQATLDGCGDFQFIVYDEHAFHFDTYSTSCAEGVPITPARLLDMPT